MKTFNILIIIALCMLTSCNQKAKIEYKYAEKEDILSCSSIDEDLIKEAIYAFDNYAFKTYAQNEHNIRKAYYNYFGVSFRKRYPSARNIDDHVKTIFEALRAEEDLWIFKNGERHLNPETILPCFAEQIESEDLKTILNNLITTDSYDKNLYLETLLSNLEYIYEDKVLASYFILETFYAKMMHLDLNDPNIIDIVYKKNDSIFRTQYNTTAKGLTPEDIKKMDLEKLEPIKLDQN